MRLIEGNLATVGEGGAHAIAEEVLSEMIVVIRDQKHLTMDDEVRFCEMIGECQRYDLQPERTKHIACHKNILRVTGEKDSDGEEGLFGHTSALDWHANQASNPDRSPLIWLKSIKGSKGSRTSWINMIKAYEDLPSQAQEDFKDLQITLGHEHGKYSTSSFFNEHHSVDNPMNLVYTNSAGKTGLYFPFLQTFGIVGKTDEEFKEIYEYLVNHVTQEKFIYHHDWKDGDVVISEQWLSIHKRWPFEKMEKRVLHRIAFDYSKIGS
tara:strand:+ start:799 stop:1596 length:798 start_codon:yes stop_codon:yes gene_type:complete